MTHDYSKLQKADQSADITLKQISILAQEQMDAEAEVARAEQNLKAAQDKLKNIAEFRLPELMDSIGMSEFTLKDGSKVQVKESLHASIAIANQPSAFGWLAEIKQDNLIKRKFEIEFGRDQEEWAKQFQKELNDRDDPLNWKCKRSVHPQTLSAFVREQLENGIEIPQSITVVRQRTSKISV